MLFPAVADLGQADLEEVVSSWLDMVDGVLLTGGTANIDPAHYQGEFEEDLDLLDPKRDATVFPLIRQVLKKKFLFWEFAEGCKS